MARTRRIVSISVFLLLAATISFAQSQGVTLTATLTGANERPNPGDVDGSGFAVVRVDPATGTINFWLLGAGIATPTAAHIHKGTADVAGSVVVNFSPTFTNGAASGTVTADPALIAEILSNPQTFYVNIHNADFPGGAIRGQLSLQPNAAGSILSTSLLGANERPTPGDADGTGFAIVRFNRAAGTVHYTLITQNVAAPTAAHIHRGGADVAGSVVVNFAPTFTNGIATGTVPTTTALIDEIMAGPAGFYVNVHNAEFPGGAVRGQLATVSAALTDLVIPVAGRTRGANGTMYRTTLTLLNSGATAAPVLIEFYQGGTVGNASPTATAALVLAGGEQKTLQGDMLHDTLHIGDVTGALRITSPASISANARIYNDQVASLHGTFGQFIRGMTSSEARVLGTLPMLADQVTSTHTGFRTNIGWFNGSGSTTTITLEARRPNGTVAATSTQTALVGAQRQMSMRELFPTHEALDNVYVTFSTTGGALYVYASVVDNVSGDAMFIPAQAR